MMAARALLAGLLLSCAAAASADEIREYRMSLGLAFVSGTPLPKAPPPDPKLAALSERIRAIQAGNDGSPETTKKLLDEIFAVAAVFSSAKPLLPPEKVIKNYLARRKDRVPPPALAGKTAKGAETEAAAETERLAGARRRAVAVAEALTVPKRDAGILPLLDSAHAAEFSPARAHSAEAAYEPGGRLPANFLKRSSMPSSYQGEITGPKESTSPTWNPSGQGDFFFNLRNYVNTWIGMKINRNLDLLQKVEDKASADCAKGWTAGCVWSGTQVVSGHIVTGIQQQGADMTSERDGVRRTAFARLTPLALLESAPQAGSAFRDMDANGYTRKSIALASLAAGVVVLDATSFGTFGILKTAEKGAAKGLSTVLRDEARAAEEGALRSGEPRAPARFLDAYGTLLKDADAATLKMIDDLEARGVSQASIRDVLVRAEKQCLEH